MNRTLQIIDAQADAVAWDALKMVVPKISIKRNCGENTRVTLEYIMILEE